MLQFYAVMAAIFAMVVITLAVLSFIKDDQHHSNEWKDLFMMVQDCNQGYEELNARVNYLERMIKAGGMNDSNR